MFHSSRDRPVEDLRSARHFSQFQGNALLHGAQRPAKAVPGDASANRIEPLDERAHLPGGRVEIMLAESSATLIAIESDPIRESRGRRGPSRPSPRARKAIGFRRPDRSSARRRRAPGRKTPRSGRRPKSSLPGSGSRARIPPGRKAFGPPTGRAGCRSASGTPARRAADRR